MTDFETARKNMVDSQIRTCDVTDRRILSVMSALPREAFLPATQHSMAYMDGHVPFHPAGETMPVRHLISPMIFAKLVQLCDVGPQDLVLDIGTGCGYGAAVLAQLAESVVGLEIDPVLARQATENLLAQDISNVAVVEGPLAKGYREECPYDVILIEGSVPSVPDNLFDQLKRGGRLVAVVGTTRSARARVFLRNGGNIGERTVFDATIPAVPGFDIKQEFVF